MAIWILARKEDRKAAIDAFDKVEILGRVLDVQIAKGSKSSTTSSDENGSDLEGDDDYEESMDTRGQENSWRAPAPERAFPRQFQTQEGIAIT